MHKIKAKLSVTYVKNTMKTIVLDISRVQTL